jgi:hypothetical protein
VIGVIYTSIPRLGRICYDAGKTCTRNEAVAILKAGINLTMPHEMGVRSLPMDDWLIKKNLKANAQCTARALKAIELS